jgi:ariadne-1
MEVPFSSVKLMCVISLTSLPNSVTKNYFENLVRALENGLEDVDSSGSKMTTSKKAATKGKSEKNNNVSTPAGVIGEDYLSCEHCTFANPVSTNTCVMCRHHM